VSLLTDRALLWSEPLARGWNTYIGAVRTQLSASRPLRELAIPQCPRVPCVKRRVSKKEGFSSRRSPKRTAPSQTTSSNAAGLLVS
jgi:hypothetical protein